MLRQENRFWVLVERFSSVRLKEQYRTQCTLGPSQNPLLLTLPAVNLACWPEAHKPCDLRELTWDSASLFSSSPSAVEEQVVCMPMGWLSQHEGSNWVGSRHCISETWNNRSKYRKQYGEWPQPEQYAVFSPVSLRSRSSSLNLTSLVSDLTTFYCNQCLQFHKPHLPNS